MSNRNLYTWNWIGGGYNQTYAETEAEAIEIGNSMTSNLEIDMKTFRKVEDVDAFWNNYPIFD